MQDRSNGAKGKKIHTKIDEKQDIYIYDRHFYLPFLEPLYSTEEEKYVTIGWRKK
jgi:hypothetical protein